MRFTVSLLAILLTISIFATCPIPVHAQRDVAISTGSRGLQEYNNGNYRMALRFYRQANEAAEAGGKYTDLERAVGYLGLAECLRCLGQFDEAEKYYKLSLSFSEKVKKSTVTPTILNDLGTLYMDRGDYAQAQKFWLESESLGGSTVYLPVNNLCRLYLEWGKLEEAQPYLIKSAALAKNKKYGKTIAIPYCCFNTGFFALLKGRYADTEAAYRESVSSCARLVGKNHNYYALTLSALADIYCRESKYPEAEKALREALEVMTLTFTDEHPEVAKLQIKLASVLCDQGKYKEAEELASKAIKTEEVLYNGQDNIFVARGKAALGNIKRQDGQYKEAAELLEKAVSTASTTLGAKNLEVAEMMRNLSRVKLDQGDYREAEGRLKASQEVVNSLTGPDHPERAAIARALGNLYMREGRLDEAEPQFKNAMELTERVLGHDHAVTADSARDLGDLYLKQKKFAEAQEFLNKALAIDEKLYGDSAPQVAADLFSLANAFDAQGQSGQAAPLLQRANAIRAKIPGSSVAEQPTVQIPVSFDGGADRPVRDKWALAIGISNFKDSSINLKYAAKDATDFSNFLVANQHFKPDHVKLLTDGEATRENIIGMLGDKWLGKLAHKDDLVLVYISSHGSSSMEAAGGVNFLVAHDTNKNSLMGTGIPMQWLTKMIKEQVQSDRVILVLDVCHSGSAAQGGKGLFRINGMSPDQITIGSGQMVLCSSLAEQVSWESKNYENSVFTRRLIEALQVNQNKTTILDAYRQLKFLVESEVLRDRANLQTPVLWNKEWSGGAPVLAIEASSAAQ
ncbi:MAG: tetratricopeptide repeat protein [Cyanobacteria bacterium]|nr:tetratricopeptide repeat protein [Cyanobacteriota bacterium]